VNLGIEKPTAAEREQAAAFGAITTAVFLNPAHVSRLRTRASTHPLRGSLESAVMQTAPAMFSLMRSVHVLVHFISDFLKGLDTVITRLEIGSMMNLCGSLYYLLSETRTLQAIDAFSRRTVPINSERCSSRIWMHL
jgi:hypothetical protein